MRKNVLFISIAFPPKNDPECLQTAKYFKYLARDDRFAFTVLTSRIPTLFMPADEQLLKYDSGYSQKIQIRIFEWKLINFVLRKIFPGGIDFPDSKFSFFKQWKKAARQITTSPDIIYSRANPLSSAIMAFHLKEHFGVPWVMHLSDPWADSPAHEYNSRQKAFHHKWEQKCFAAASKISLTSRKALEFYSAKYPQWVDKLFYSPNTYDPDDKADRPVHFNGKLTIVYTGGLSWHRPISGLLDALVFLRASIPDLEKRIDVVFAGPIDRISKTRIDNAAGLIKHVGQLSYPDALQLLGTAHILLSIDMEVKDPEKSMFFPSKLLDYFLIGRKILAFTNQNSTTDNVLRKTNAAVFEQRDVAGIAAFIRTALTEYENKNLAYFNLNDLPEEFNAKTQSRILADILNSFEKSHPDRRYPARGN
jgi:glycosyltransferase involved in cell wall biosynthesis